MPSRAPSSIAVVLLAGFQGGGAERVARALVDGSSATGQRVVLVTNSGPEGDRYRTSVDAERIVLGVDLDESRLLADGVLHSLPRVVRLLWRMRRSLRAARTDVVISMLTSANLLTIVAACCRRVRVVISERTDTTLEDTPRAMKVARRFLYRFADVVTANSQASIDDMARYVPRAKLAFVPNSVVVPKRVARPSHARTMVSVGRLIESKHPLDLVDAFAKVAAGTQWRLLLVGAGPLEEAVRDRASLLGVDQQVELPGYLEKVDAVLDGAAIFVLASRYEGTPNALLEAMAAGLPSVVPDTLTGALAYVDHGETGLVFAHGVIDDLGKQLERLMRDGEQRDRLGRAARARMAELDPAIVQRRWDAIIDQARASGSRRGTGR